MDTIMWALGYIIPHSLMGWTTSAIAIGALLFAGYVFGFRSITELLAKFLTPIAEKAGQALANFPGWFGTGMKGIWDNPWVMIPMVIFIGVAGWYGGVWPRKEAAAAKVELSKCKTQIIKKCPAKTASSSCVFF